MRAQTRDNISIHPMLTTVQISQAVHSELLNRLCKLSVGTDSWLHKIKTISRKVNIFTILLLMSGSLRWHCNTGLILSSDRACGQSLQQWLSINSLSPRVLVQFHEKYLPKTAIYSHSPKTQSLVFILSIICHSPKFSDFFFLNYSS